MPLGAHRVPHTDKDAVALADGLVEVRLEASLPRHAEVGLEEPLDVIGMPDADLHPAIRNAYLFF